MARLPLIVQNERRKRIGLAITIWLQMCTIASWFLVALGAIHSLHTYRPRVRSYILDFYAKRDYVKRLVYASDETCIEQVRMNRTTFFKLCEMLQTLGELKSSRNMLVDEQVATFLHIISHHLKNRVIKHHFNRSGETVSRSFHNVLNAVIRLQDVLFKKAKPITANSTDPRWKWFKNCLSVLDGTHIKIRVPTVDKPRYRMRKGDIVTNMLGVCTPDMQFVYDLPGWEGSIADRRVLRDAISRRHGLKVLHGCYYLVDAGYTNCEGFLAPFRGQRYHLNEWRQGYQPSTQEEFFNMKHASVRNVIERCFGLLKLRWGILRSPSFYPIVISGFSQSSISSQSSRGTKRKWVLEEDAALVACMVDLHNAGTFNADNGFKAGYLNELEKMLEKVLPNAMLKAKPNLESRIKTLKRDWSIVYDILSGKNNSGFGWDKHRQLVVAEDASHKEAAQFRHRSFLYYDQLTAIYAKDQATGKDAQIAVDIIEEINAEDVAATNSHEERNDCHGSEADVSLDDMDLLATQPQPEPQLARNQGDYAFSKKKKKISDASDFSTSFNDAAALLVENIWIVGLEISKSIASEVVIQQKSEMTIQESALKLYPTLCEVEGLTEDESY
ncbi:hypothetical protein CXB51_002796 [Gossypium anomalum]|uniref:Myb/SANT-like domain-containing protein n=1 Tax=Gossypium anomalum TaxID=47600 RepID=A0A8J5ZF18_9ROSI|nr:hypothetical protein CXB51_002796 [Gossypium anomalum]